MMDRKAVKVKVVPVKRAVRIRRGLPIHGYVGPNGSGKSLAMILDTLPSLARGRTVLSTVTLLDPATGLEHPQFERLDSYAKLRDAHKCDVLLDEVNGVASSRASQGMPAQIEKRLVQLRRGDVAVRWTAPAWGRADVIIRECSQGVTVCNAFLGETITDDSGDERLWTSKRLMWWKTYDAKNYDEWTHTQTEKHKPMTRQLFWRPGSLASQSYNTLDPVDSLVTTSEAGSCLDCGGNRPRVKCSCPATPIAATPDVTDFFLIEETDETPAIAFQLPTVDPANAVGSP